MARLSNFYLYHYAKNLAVRLSQSYRTLGDQNIHLETKKLSHSYGVEQRAVQAQKAYIQLESYALQNTLRVVWA